jgi:2-polyprenyl-3-methyl-5-hydroxy-6-metoxy-1,4-benzoquinol methylase
VTSKYAAQSVNLGDPNSSTTKIFNLVPEQAGVLDVGCSAGYLGRALIEHRGARVWGLELDPDDAQVARNGGYEQVWLADLDGYDWSELEGREFDAILLADVLEHLKHPGEVLARAAEHLSAGGRVIASIPNVAHMSVRIELMQGIFAYDSFGILDDTHLKYFTKRTILDLFRSAGLAVSHLEATLADVPEDLLEERLQSIGLSSSPSFLKLMDSDEARAFQYVLVAGKGGDHAPEVEAGQDAIMSEARLGFEHTRLRVELEETRRRLVEIEGSRAWRLAKAMRGAYLALRARLPGR